MNPIKQICRFCREIHPSGGKNSKPSEWGNEDDTLWERGIVACPNIGRNSFLKSSIPEKCHFRLEQLDWNDVYLERHQDNDILFVKSVCENCYKTNDLQWTEFDELSWRVGKILEHCPYNSDKLGEIAITDVSKDCPYTLEHLVLKSNGEK